MIEMVIIDDIGLTTGNLNNTNALIYVGTITTFLITLWLNVI